MHYIVCGTDVKLMYFLCTLKTFKLKFILENCILSSSNHHKFIRHLLQVFHQWGGQQVADYCFPLSISFITSCNYKIFNIITTDNMHKIHFVKKRHLLKIPWLFHDFCKISFFPDQKWNSLTFPWFWKKN